MTVSVRVRSHTALRDVISARCSSQRELAATVGVSPTWINLLAQGKRDTLALDHAVHIEDTLGVSRGSLFWADPNVAAYLPGDSEAGAA